MCYVCAGAYVWLCMWRPGPDMKFLSQSLPLILLTVSFTESGAQRFRQTDWPASSREPPVSISLVLEL